MAKKRKRDLVKYPGLDKRFFSKIKQEYHDIDYAHKLSDKDQKWLSQFMEENLGAQLNEKTLKNKYNKKPIHKSKAQKKDCYDRNNARQRDIYGLSRATGKLNDYDSNYVADYIESMSKDDMLSYEDELIKKLDDEKD